MEELDKFLGLVIARDVLGARNQETKSLWNLKWGYPIFNETMTRNRFTEILRFVRFDEKSQRKHRIANDKFLLALAIWKLFIENCQKVFIPSENVTVDEQLLPCKARCNFIQYMANKPDKFGIKFWLGVDVETKYLFNGFPYLGRDDSRPKDVSVSSDEVIKIMEPLFSKGYNVSCDNFFTSVDLLHRLAKKQCSLVGTFRQNRRELPELSKQKKKLHETTAFIS